MDNRKAFNRLISAEQQESCVDSRVPGGSLEITNDLTLNILQKIAPTTMVDLGCGNGKYGRMIREMSLAQTVEIIGVDVYEPTIRWLEESGVYTSVHCEIISRWLHENSDRHYDVTVFGDVLEHMTRSSMYEALDLALSCSDNVLVISPLRYLRSSDHADNPWQAHRVYLFDTDFDAYYIMEKHVIRVPRYADYSKLVLWLKSDPNPHPWWYYHLRNMKRWFIHMAH
ncbi:MAG: hypothetical protein U9N73_04585 [Candidatus Auribacterota bacterium]|nr:hypothetical protein [Candidatus Auribacterota bacterium]